MAKKQDAGKATTGYKARSTAPAGGTEVPGPVRQESSPEDARARRIERRPVRPEPSRYAKRSAHLPHLGDEADHDILDEMEILRADSPQR